MGWFRGSGAGGVAKEIKNSSSKGGTLQTGSNHDDENRRKKNQRNEERRGQKQIEKNGWGIF